MVGASLLFFKSLLGLSDGTEQSDPPYIYSALWWVYFMGHLDGNLEKNWVGTPNFQTWLSCFGLFVDVLCSLPCRPSLGDKVESGHLAPASPQPLPSNHHLLPTHFRDTAEFPTSVPTLPEGHTLEALPTPPASPCPPHPAPASPPASSADPCEDVYPASAPCHIPLRYEHVAAPEPLHLFGTCKKVMWLCVLIQALT